MSTTTMIKSAASEDSMMKKIAALTSVKDMCGGTEDIESEDDDEDDGEGTPSSSGGISLITQHPTPVYETPKATRPSAKAKKGGGSRNSSSSGKAKKQPPVGGKTTKGAKKSNKNRSGENSLPEGLEQLTRKDQDNFKIDFDNDCGGIVVKIIGKGGEEYDPKEDLFLSQLRKLASNVGVRNHHAANTNKVCRLIAEAILDEGIMEKAGIHPEKAVAKKNYSLCRLINCLFSEPFFQRLPNVNSLHTRIHHETGQTNKKFWEDLAKYYTKPPEEALEDLNKIYGADDSADAPADPVLKAFSDQLDAESTKQPVGFTEEGMKKLLRDFFKVRKGIKDRMTQSGTHSNSPWDFVQAALNDIKDQQSGSVMVTKDASYYFFCRCAEHPGIEAHFQMFLDENVKGSSEDFTKNDDIVPTRKRMSMETIFEDMQGSTKTIVEEIHRGNQKKEATSKHIAQSNLMMCKIKSMETQLQAYMFMKDQEQVAECTKKLKEYTETLDKMDLQIEDEGDQKEDESD
jgi:hypothetical protein